MMDIKQFFLNKIILKKIFMIRLHIQENTCDIFLRGQEFSNIFWWETVTGDGLSIKCFKYFVEKMYVMMALQSLQNKTVRIKEVHLALIHSMEEHHFPKNTFNPSISCVWIGAMEQWTLTLCGNGTMGPIFISPNEGLENHRKGRTTQSWTLAVPILGGRLILPTIMTKVARSPFRCHWKFDECL